MKEKTYKQEQAKPFSGNRNRNRNRYNTGNSNRRKREREEEEGCCCRSGGAAGIGRLRDVSF